MRYWLARKVWKQRTETISTKPDQGSVRLIGGKWRGRKLKFREEAGLRPSPDRVRETLFNWLQFNIVGTRCLDLFAGTGALGLEALSRGAAHVTLVESHSQTVSRLREQLALLQTTSCELINSDAFEFLQSQEPCFDIIFLDPPFGQKMLSKACGMLKNRGHLRSGVTVYAESDEPVLAEPPLDLYKQGKAGNVHFALLKVDE